MLYKLKTSKVFEKHKVEGKLPAEIVEEDPFAVQLMYWCPESRLFCVAGVSAYVIVYRFSKHEVNTEISVSIHMFCLYGDLLMLRFDKQLLNAAGIPK